ncbi:MAG: alpha/beta fold hydrolase [Actinomycetota bacterium]|nr:alpha/beta fold hydrolase [Actinomycetota bacterium]
MARRGVGHFAEGRYPHFLQAYLAGMAELPAVTAQTDVGTGFGDVRVYRFDGPGPATPVVLLPGRNASTPMWRANLPGLVARRTVYAVDLLGEAGMSVQTRPIDDARDQAQWLEDALAGLDLRRVHLLGASIGGWAAANFAARFPGRVASLTLLDPVMTFGTIPARTLVASALMALPTPKSFRRWFLSWVSGGVMADDAVPEIALIDAATTDFVLRLPPPTPITDDQLRGLTMPVLAFLGGRSVMLDADSAARRARTLLPHCVIEVVADASHAISGECAERIEQVATEFWDEVDRT